MVAKLLFSIAALGLFSTVSMAATTGNVELTWFGQACFLIRDSKITIAMDPYTKKLGYGDLRLRADVVTVSHEHFDHNAVEDVSGKPDVLRGLKKDGTVEAINTTIKGVRIHTVASFHDDVNGTKRGDNAIFVIEMNGLRIVHLGDLGHVLSPEQVKSIGRVDVLLIPVGGFYTIDAKTAAHVVGQLNPRIVVPMHFKTKDTAALPIQSDQAFDGLFEHVVKAGHTLKLSTAALPRETRVYRMQYK